MSDRLVIDRGNGRTVLESPNGQGLTPVGPWDAARYYKKGDVVSKGGSSFVCLVSHLNQEPPGELWMTLVSGSGSPNWENILGKPPVLDTLPTELQEIDSALTALEQANASVQDTLPTLLSKVEAADVYALKTHTHSAGEITGLTEALSDFLTEEEGNAAYAPKTHGHAISEVTGLQGALDAKDVASSAISDRVTAIEADFLTSVEGDAAYAPIAHQHEISQVTNLQLILDGLNTSYTGLGALVAAQDIEINDLQTAVTSLNGGMTSTIAELAAINAALNGKANIAHTHAIADVTGLQTALDGKSNTGHGHAIADVSGLQTALDGKAATSHTQAIATITGLQTALDGKAALSHGHALSDLLQSGATTGQAVVWNGSMWAPGSGLPTGTLAQYLRFDGTSWAASLLQKADIETALIGGFTLTGTGANRMTFDTPTAQTRGVRMRTNGFDVWGFFATVAETFTLTRYNPATGALVGNVLSAANDTGLLTYNGSGITLQTGDLTVTAGNIIYGTASSKLRMGATSLAIQNSGGSDRVMFMPAGNVRLEQSQARYGFNRVTDAWTITANRTVNYDWGQSLVLSISGSGTPGVLTVNNPSPSAEISGYSWDFSIIIRNTSTDTAFPAANISWGNLWRLPVAGLPDIPANRAMVISGVRTSGEGSFIASATITTV